MFPPHFLMYLLEPYPGPMIPPATTTIPNPSWALEERGETLRTPQNVPTWTVSHPHYDDDEKGAHSRFRHKAPNLCSAKEHTPPLPHTYFCRVWLMRMRMMKIIMMVMITPASVKAAMLVDDDGDDDDHNDGNGHTHFSQGWYADWWRWRRRRL